MIAARAVPFREFVIVDGGQAQRGRPRLLQRRGRADGKKVVYLADGAGDRGRRYGPADAPSGDAVAFGEPVDGARCAQRKGRG